MMYQNKKRRLSEFEKKLLLIGYDDDKFLEICDYHDENKKWVLQSLTDISNHYEQKNYKLWIKLISIDWFSIFLTYLDMKDIGRLDSALTNREHRPKWLHLLKNIEPYITLKNNLFIDEVSNWLIQKMLIHQNLH